MAPEFVPALELNAGFYRDIVEPVVRAWRHSAALLGSGSELLGFDTERSTDHGWGPRLQLFVAPDDITAVKARVDAQLPTEYCGWPVKFGWDDVPRTHHVDVVALSPWLRTQLGCDPTDATKAMTNADWLTMPQQRILGVVRGAVYHDGTGELTDVRRTLHYFPADVRLWMLACQWRRVAQEEPLVGRAAEVGDVGGSRLIAARIVRDLMRLHFLLAGEYWPYAKWFGSAYRQLPHADEMIPALEHALDADNYPDREGALVAAYEALARIHNATELTTTLAAHVQPFYGRPYRVLGSDRFVAACLDRVTDERLRSLPLIGSIDQTSDSTDVLVNADAMHALRALYEDAS